MMYAVVETSGKQYQAQEGKYIDIDLLKDEPEAEVTLENVVAIIAGDKTQIGQPYVEGATVKAKVLKHGKAKKVIAYKMKRKKGYRVKQGHRQDFTRILIEDISFPKKEETLKYVKEVEEKVEKEQKAQEEKLQKAKDKKLAKKEAKKAEKKTETKAKKEEETVKVEEPAVEEVVKTEEIKEEVKAEETATEEKVEETETTEAKTEETTEEEAKDKE